MRRYENLAIADPVELCLGRCVKPLITRRGLCIGGGTVYPELNFTLPTMLVDEETMPEVRNQYRQIITGALQRAVELEAPGLVVEFETLPPMTENPAWGIELTRILPDAMEAALLFRKWLVEFDAALDPQVYVLTPDSVIALARAIVSAPTPLAAVRLLREAQKAGRLKIHPREFSWLDRIEKTEETIPGNEPEFIAETMGGVDTTKFVPADYDL